MAVGGRRILALGSRDEVESLRGPDTRIVDLEGRFVVPGFMDSHTHFIRGGLEMGKIDLGDVSSSDEFIARVKEYARGLPQDRWITGGDWDHERWGGELPQRSWIDSVAGDIPLFVTRVDGHMGLANSRALELAGIDSQTPAPPGGVIVRDPLTGKPTGILKEMAMSLIESVVPEPSQEELDDALARAMEFAASQGITQIHDMCVWRDLETYRRAHDRNDLTLRVYAFVWYTDWERLISFVEKNGRGDSWLRWGGVKAILDGSLGSQTAWMYRPYEDDTTTSGMVVSEDTVRLREIIAGADKAGLQLAIHAIGDRANDWLLDTYEAQITQGDGGRDRRFRIEHAQHLTTDALERFHSLGVIASMQPYHAIDDGRWAEKRIRGVVLKTSYAFRSLLDAKAIVSFGSDWNVAPLDPLKGVYAAVTRRTLDGKHPEGWYPDQKITVEEALRAYTWANAYA
ncbi:MAG: amidohydrolase, partial [Fidelibacterota bacterium]